MRALVGRGGGELRIVLAASDARMRDALVIELKSAGFDVCAVERRAAEAIEAAFASAPDVFVVTTDLVGSAVVAAGRIAEVMPRTKVVVVADAPDEDDCLTYVMVGASAYVGRATGPGTLEAAVRAVVAGRAVVPPAAQRRLLDELRPQLT